MGELEDRRCTAKKLGRLDMQIEIMSINEETRTASFKAIPDPRRYDRVEIDGKKLYLDRYLDLLVPFEDFAEQLAGLPVFSLSPRILSTPAYAGERKEAIGDSLAGKVMRRPSTAPAQHKELPNVRHKRSLAFLSVDICSSTSLRLRDPDRFDKSADILINELKILAGQFNATVLKPTGDGFIVYLDHPSFDCQCDNIVDLGVSMLRLTDQAIRPALKAASLPALNIRVGADYGAASVQPKAIDDIGYKWTHVASNALNLAVKIEQSASPNTMRIGRDLYELIHVQWLERTTPKGELKFDEIEAAYRIYEIS
ncbi:hypothetical protein [Xanthomonas cannabis]|uniref:hypothetical protein n=1 Tax=Xanthomonas cannabis TaxID=1885674 RepID=UPI00141B4D71|nr:hypothetical protein [Xanthomonas cannabis]NIK17401.1 class 3 adenylate cyclase [Xanthomonas cannabis]